MDSQKTAVFFSQIPTAISGVALAIASLGVAWENVISSNGLIALLMSFLSAFIIVMLFIKFLLNPSLLIDDLQHPIASSTIPTVAMALMVLANTLADYYFLAAELLSWLAIVLHLLMFVSFVAYRSKRMQLQLFLPSCFIPPIGLVLAVITHPGGLPDLLAEGILVFGFICYAVMLPIVLYRLKALPVLSYVEQPILVILATPASLLLLAYLMMAKTPHLEGITALLGLAVLMTLYAYLQLPRLVKLPFSPTYSALTFPLVVGALALFKMQQVLQLLGIMTWAEYIHWLAYLELGVATIMTSYVLACYITSLLNTWRVKH